VSKNVSPMVFQMEEATYLLGIVAARESKSGKAGVVGGLHSCTWRKRCAATNLGRNCVAGLERSAQIDRFSGNKVLTGSGLRLARFATGWREMGETKA